MTTYAVTPARAMSLVGQGVLIELTRRKDVYVLAILMALFALGAYAVNAVGVENPATATMLLNLGLTLVYAATHVLTLLLALRQFPSEIENRTIYPLLARPLQRSWLVTGKWAACTGSGLAVLAVLFPMGWAPVPKQALFHAATMGQMLGLEAVSIGLVAALGIMASLLMPRGLALVIVGVVVVAGHRITGFLENAIASDALRRMAGWLFAYLPNFSKLNLVTRYTDGIEALPWTECAALGLYGALFILCALAVAHWSFARRTI